MTKHPLSPGDEPAKDTPPPGHSQPSYLLPARHELSLTPPSGNTAPTSSANPAADLMRDRVSQLYNTAPDAKEELTEAEHATHRSPHQEFMYKLSTSGKSLADIQTEWYTYYSALPDDQKHQVWQEFYDANNVSNQYQHPAPARSEPTSSRARQVLTTPRTQHRQGGTVVADHAPTTTTSKDKRSSSAIQQAIRDRIKSRTAKLSVRHRRNLHSLLFGLSSGLVVMLVIMFGFFNEVIIAPFIQPGRAAATPIIIDNNSAAASGGPKVIIPKINVEIPVVYNVSSNAESVIEDNLLNGVVHYPTTVLPGQNGNAAFFGHSSNNIFNKGKYKFAFVLLHTLVPGDTFYLTNKGTVYGYKVISRTIVDPSEVGVLNDIPGQTATATLITCDPPGTSLHRLVVVGQQISPDPTGNKAGENTSAAATSNSTQLAGNGPTLWSRFWNWIF